MVNMCHIYSHLLLIIQYYCIIINYVLLKNIIKINNIKII